MLNATKCICIHLYPRVEHCSTLDTCIHLYSLVSTCIARSRVNANWIQVDTCCPGHSLILMNSFGTCEFVTYLIYTPAKRTLLRSELKSATCVPCCGRFCNQSRTQHDRGRRRFLRATNATTSDDTAQLNRRHHRLHFVTRQRMI